MNIATGSRDPSLVTYVLRGVAFLVALLILFVVLFLRYQGTFTATVPVTAKLTDVGDGLTTSADVRYNGLIVGTVKSIELSGDVGPGNLQYKNVDIDVSPDQAEGIPANVTARMQKEIAEVLKDPETLKKYKAVFFEPQHKASEPFKKHVLEDLAKWKEIAGSEKIVMEE